jgi:hypothetical protein
MINLAGSQLLLANDLIGRGHIIATPIARCLSLPNQLRQLVQNKSRFAKVWHGNSCQLANY